ncbi:hypothetical protein CYY_003104 [Polysphondylium violaceum]|uniref:Mitochondrial import inner membrane translocase subunit Tim21 n=1 Tax=Polysphondylium violaceum TaxID=133409 RepID=A0A8J4V910_9MYCE|nr:hypothetical protein CYY_003104 [Polysphondylium violaceum]
MNRSLNLYINLHKRSFTTSLLNRNQQQYYINNNRYFSTTINNNKTTEQKEEQENKQKEQETKEETKDENKTQGEQQQQQQQTEEKPKTLKEKIISKLKWGSILGSIFGTLGFLFYESHLRHTLPYRKTMARLEQEDELLKKFGGKVTSIKWYKCFVNPIWGHVENEEGGMSSVAKLTIPICRTPPPPPPKEGEKQAELLPEEKALLGFDGGAQEGIVTVEMRKASPYFYDWYFHSLTVMIDNKEKMTIVKPYEYPTTKSLGLRSRGLF